MTTLVARIVVAWIVFLPFVLRAEDDLDGLLGVSREDVEATPQPSGSGTSSEDGETSTAGGGPEEVTGDPDGAEARKDRPARVVEEIIVTAQKTEQRLEDVPISMSVLSEDFIEEQHITDFVGISPYVPNARVNVGGSGANDVRLRGLGSTYVNKAFEQPAGLVTDGIPYNRLPYFFGTLFDIERIEVLRGPQGTLVGKNTTAGAFNVTTKRPTDELVGDLGVELGDFERRRLEAAIGGPLVAELVNFRIAGLLEDRQGYLENTTARIRAGVERHGPSRGRDGIRAKLDFPDLLGGRLGLSYERVSTEDRGFPSEIRLSTPSWVDFQRRFDPNFDSTPFNGVTSSIEPAFGRVDIDTVVIDAGYDLAGWPIDLLGGYSKMRFQGLTGFPTASPTFHLLDGDENPQTTLELRTTSPGLAGLFGLERLFGLDLGRSGLMAGFFFQRRKIDSDKLAVFNAAYYAAETAAARGVVPGVDEPLPLPPILATSPATTGLEEDLRIIYGQTSDSIAGFSNMSWTIGRATFEYGMRLTHEAKNAHWDVSTPRPGAVVLAATQGGFRADKNRSELAFTPKVSLLYDWTDDINTYAFWAKGFKGGGFNEFAFIESSATTVSPEEVSDWEVGAKMRLLEGAMALNVGLFRMDLTNLQVFQVITSPPSAVALNAGESRSQGVEIDGTWFPADWFRLTGAFGFNDVKFLDYPLGGCASDNVDSDGNGDGACDLSGRQVEKAPRWTVALVPAIEVPLAFARGSAGLPGWMSALDLIGSITGEYQDVHKVDFGLNPEGRQPSFFRFNGTLGLADAEQGWSLGVAAENFTNAEVATFAVEVFGAGNYQHFIQPPRAVFGWFRWSF